MTPRRRSFTLIELLVVIAIIALLVSILMPSMRKARALARRSVCLSNLRSLCSMAMLYANDADGSLPAPPPPGAAGWQGIGAGQNFAKMSLKTNDGQDLGPNGYYLMAQQANAETPTAYLAEGLGVCPSMDFDPATLWPYTSDKRSAILHYDYRYNANCVQYTGPTAGKFLASASPNNVLFSDAAGYRLNSTTAEVYTRTITPHIPQSGGVRWAHQTGGNMMAVHGGGRWIPNVVFGTGYAEAMCSWPGWFLYPVHTSSSGVFGLDNIYGDAP